LRAKVTALSRTFTPLKRSALKSVVSQRLGLDGL
jgi:hypothetical protein